MADIIRCEWCTSHQIMQDYHDKEWGVPVTDDRRQFEHLVLETFQSGLSWLIILNKRENFRKAFAGFDPVKVAEFDESDYERLMQDAGIVRNKLKIRAVINNAPLFVAISREFDGFHNFLEQFRPNPMPVYESMSEIPGKTEESAALAKELKKRGFKFLGPTTCYAHMQSVGIVNDHEEICFRFHGLTQ